MEIFLQHVFTWIDSSKYVLLFLGCLVEGPIIMIVCGFLYSLGQFHFLPMYMALVSGNFIADIFWYHVGKLGTRNAIFKYGHFIGITPDRLEKAEKYFHKYHQKILIITKLTAGFGLAFIIFIVAGMFKTPLKNYLFISLIGGFIWAAFLLALGYFFGNIFIMIPSSMKIIFIVIVLIIFAFAARYINQFMKKKEILS